MLTDKWVNTVFNSLQNGKKVEQSKSKAFADDTTNSYERLKCFHGRVENIVGKGKTNADYQQFLLFPHSLASFFGRI